MVGVILTEIGCGYHPAGRGSTRRRDRPFTAHDGRHGDANRLPTHAWHRWLAAATSFAALAMSCASQSRFGAGGRPPGTRRPRRRIRGSALSLAAGTRPRIGKRSASTIRSRPGATCGCRATAAPRSTTAAASFGLPATPTYACRASTIGELVLFIARGQVIVRVRAQEPGDATRIDTPNTQVTLARPGLYRIDVTPDGRPPRSRCARARRSSRSPTARSRRCRARRCRWSAPIPPTPTSARRRAWMDSTPGARSATVATTVRGRRRTSRQDGRLCGSRRVRIVADLSGLRRGLVPDVRGARLGAVSRRLLDGGRPWGLTWVDQAPWGYAPFHYGRWAYISGRWGWCPGSLRRASRLGAGAGRVVRRRQLGTLRRSRRAGLRLGAARLARGLPSVVAAMLVRLLGSLQPAVFSECDCAAHRAAAALREPHGSGGDVRRRSSRTRATPAGAAESRPGAPAPGDVGAGDAHGAEPDAALGAQCATDAVTGESGFIVAALPQRGSRTGSTAVGPDDPRDRRPRARRRRCRRVCRGRQALRFPARQRRATVAPAPSAQGQTTTVAPAPAPTSPPVRGARAGGERSGPDAPPGGTSLAR